MSDTKKKTAAKAKKQTENNDPDYIVYFVPDRKGARWAPYGAAWYHKDGEGLSVEEDFKPDGDGRTVFRKYEPQEEE